MGRIPDTLFTNFTDGQTIHASDIIREREIMRVAINDFDDKVNSVLVDTENNANSKSYNLLFPPAPMLAPKADGTNDSIAIQNIYNALPEYSTLEIPNATFYISSSLTFNRNINIKGNKGQSIFITDVDNAVLTISGTDAKTTSLSVASTVGDKINVGDVAGITNEQLVYIEDSTRMWEADPRVGEYYGEVNLVKSVSANDITLFMQTATDYPINTPVKIYNPLSNIEVSGITFKRKARNTNSGIALALVYTRNILIKDLFMDGYGAAGIIENKSVGNTYQNIYAIAGFYSGVGLGYGIQINASIFTQINDSHFFDYRRGIDFSGGVPSRYISAKDCTAVSSTVSADDANGFGTHGTAEYCSFENCRVFGSKNAFIIRGNNITLKDCSGYGVANVFATFGAGSGHVVDGCWTDKYYTSNYSTPTFVNINSPNYTSGEKSIIIKDCVPKFSNYFISITEAAVSSTVYVKNIKGIGRSSNAFFAFSSARSSNPIQTKIVIENVSFVERNGNDLDIAKSEGANSTISIVEGLTKTAINKTPSYVGQFSVVGGIGYLATGTSSTADWKQITN